MIISISLGKNGQYLRFETNINKTLRKYDKLILRKAKKV